VKARIGAACLMAALLVCGGARADPIRILVAVSHDRGSENEPPLRHASEDADSVRDVLSSIGGVPPSAAIRLVDPKVAQLRSGIERARSIAATHSPAEVTFVLYFSGHGDRERIHLGSEAVSLAELVELARAVPAALRVVVTDACRNDSTRPKGIVTEPARHARETLEAGASPVRGRRRRGGGLRRAARGARRCGGRCRCGISDHTYVPGGRARPDRVRSPSPSNGDDDMDRADRARGAAASRARSRDRSAVGVPRKRRRGFLVLVGEPHRAADEHEPLHASGVHFVRNVLDTANALRPVFESPSLNPNFIAIDSTLTLIASVSGEASGPPVARA